MIEEIDPTAEDQLIFLGDYIDRGPSSRDVVNQVIELQSRCNVVPLLGNHEIMLMGVALRGLDQDAWLRSGGKATVTKIGLRSTFLIAISAMAAAANARTVR